MDIANKNAVGVQGQNIVFILPVPRQMSKQEALVFAAWIVALADEKDEFKQILEEVENC